MQAAMLWVIYREGHTEKATQQGSEGSVCPTTSMEVTATKDHKIQQVRRQTVVSPFNKRTTATLVPEGKLKAFNEKEQSQETNHSVGLVRPSHTGQITIN